MSDAFGIRPNRKVAKFALITVMGVVLMPMMALADTADEIKATIMQNNANARENLSDEGESASKHGSLEFWSSGGLIQYVAADAPASTFENFALTPKHIEVITLVEDQAAVAMYYLEGSFHETGQKAVLHYMTRVTEVYVKEDGEWKQRAGHYSPITGGQGTQQTSQE